MKTSAEISYYPLKEEFKPTIKNFIRDLQSHPEIKVEPGSMSTRIFGSYEDVMRVLSLCMKNSFEEPNSIFVLKIMNMDRDK